MVEIEVKGIQEGKTDTFSELTVLYSLTFGSMLVSYMCKKVNYKGWEGGAWMETNGPGFI